MPGPKVLAQHAGDTSFADVYTCPAGGGAIVSSIVVSNTSISTAYAFEVRIAPGGAANSPTHTLVPYTGIEPSDRVTFTEGLTLAPGDKVRVKCNSSGFVIVHLYGTEL